MPLGRCGAPHKCVQCSMSRCPQAAWRGYELKLPLACRGKRPLTCRAVSEAASEVNWKARATSGRTMQQRGLFTGLSASEVTPRQLDCPAVMPMHVAAEDRPEKEAAEQANSCGDYFGLLLRLSKSSRHSSCGTANAPAQAYALQEHACQHSASPQHLSGGSTGDARSNRRSALSSASASASLSRCASLHAQDGRQGSGLLRRAKSTRLKRGTSSHIGKVPHLWDDTQALWHPDSEGARCLHKSHSAALPLAGGPRLEGAHARSASAQPTALGSARSCDSTQSNVLPQHWRLRQSDVPLDEEPEHDSLQPSSLCEALEA